MLPAVKRGDVSETGTLISKDREGRLGVLFVITAPVRAVRAHDGLLPTREGTQATSSVALSASGARLDRSKRYQARGRLSLIERQRCVVRPAPLPSL